MSDHDDYDDDYEPEDHRDPRRRSDHRRNGDDAIIDRKDANQFAQDAFKKSANALANAKIGESKKFLGIFTLDAGIVDMLDGAYNFGADFVSSKLRPKIFQIVEKAAPKIGLGGHAKSAAALAAMGSTAAIKMGGYFGPIYEGMSSQIKEQRALARSIAPVLDDIKGNHSVAALYTLGLHDNEVIYAHRKRLGKIASATNVTNFINLGINSGTNLAFDLKGFHGIWKNRETLTHLDVNHALTAKPKAKGEETERPVEDTSGTNVLKAGLLSMLPQIAKRIAVTGQHKLRTELQPYSALEMILELSEQVSSSPDASAFQEPKSFQSPNGHRKQYPLEEYIMRIFIQHQKDMADVSPNHTEIREALRQDLAAVAKPIAEAIKSGDMSALSLIRMVGEGKVIKKNGRGIAGVEEVKALIKREAPKQASYVHTDPAEYYKDAAFTRAQLKSALKALEGEEKLSFAAMFPDAVLAEAGMGKKEIRAMRDATVKHYDKIIAEAVVGLNAKSDEELKKEGLAENEVKHVREANGKIQDSGIEAVKQLKTSAANENGIEHLLTNAVVHKPSYFGKLVKNGHKLFAENAANDEKPVEKPHHSKHGHAERVASKLHGKHGVEAQNDDEYLGAANAR